MRKLATATGYSVGALYLYFRSKEDVFHNLTEQNIERLSRCLIGLRERHKASDPVVLLKKAMYTYVEFGTRNSADYGLAIEVYGHTQGFGAESVIEIIRSIVDRCVAEGSFRDVEIDTVAHALWAAVHGVTYLITRSRGFTSEGRAKVVEQVINNAIDSLRVDRAQISRHEVSRVASPPSWTA